MKKKDLRSARERQRRRENRETILHAAEAVILRQGFSAASMDDVAEEAQFSKATLYRYFKSKAELVFEVLVKFLEDLECRLRDIRNRPAGARERLGEWVACSLRFLSENENLTRVFLLDRSFMRLLQIFVARQNRARTEEEKSFIRRIRAKREERLAVSRILLRDGVASGEFRAMDLDAGVAFIEAVIEGYFVENFWNESKPDIEKDIGYIQSFIFQGIENVKVSKGETA